MRSVRSSRAPPTGLLVLDFDGTISTMVEHPNDAVAIEGVIDTLCELTAKLTVAFITGRPVDWLVDRTTPCAEHGVEYIGLHGHERLRDGEIVPHPESGKWRDHITSVLERAQTSAPDDVVLEPKGLGLALHFRTSPTAEKWIRAFTADAAHETGLIAHDTRFAVELRPPVDLDKGDAMHELIDDYAAAKRWRFSVTTWSTSPPSPRCASIPMSPARRCSSTVTKVRKSSPRSPIWCCQVPRRGRRYWRRCSPASTRGTRS